MSLERKTKKARISPIVEAKSLLSIGDAAGALEVLKEGEKNGDLMACFDRAFLIMHGIGCIRNMKEGFELLEKGVKEKKKKRGNDWKADGSVTELLGPQSINMYRLFPSMRSFK